MTKRIIYIAIAVLLFGIFLYASRGPNISNALKRIILPELETATGRKFIAQKIYVNLFPLFVEIKGLKSFDDNGERIIEVQRVKGYIGLSGLIQKKVFIKRLVITEPNLRTDRKQIEDISANIKKYLAQEPKMPFKVEVKSVTIANAELFYQDSDYKLLLGGFNSDVIIARNPKFIVSSKRVVFDKKGLNEATGALESVFYLKDTIVDLKKFKITSDKSGVFTSGSLDTKSLIGRFLSEATVYVDTVKKIFGLKRNGEGSLTVNGSIGIDGRKPWIDSVFVDIKVDGDLFLETLMELLKVKEKIAGHINVDGFLKGPIDKLHAEGKAVLDNGVLFGVPIERLSCKVLYRDGAMRFLNGHAQVLHGNALAEGMIRLPVVNYFEVKVKAEDVSSSGLLKLIGLDRVLPEGKVRGTLASSGNVFDPEGEFYYKSTVAGRDVLGRVREAKSPFIMKNNVIHFDNMSFATDKSKLSSSGSIDLNNNTLSFQGTGGTTDIGDLTFPYFAALSGPARFSHVVSGSLNNPDIDLHFDAEQTVFSTKGLASTAIVNNSVFVFDTINGDVNYRKDRLTVKYFSAVSRPDPGAPQEKISAGGTVLFPRAGALFDLKKPDFNLSLFLQNIDIKTLVAMFTGKVKASGVLNTYFNLSGGIDTIRLSGDVHGSGMTIADQYALDSADGHVTWEGRSVSFKALRLKKGASSAEITGTVGPHDKFSINAAARSIKVSDIISEKRREKLKAQYKELFVDNFFDTLFLSNLNIRGEGTFESPVLSLKSDINAGAYRGRPVGGGDIQGTLNGKHATITARLLDKKMTIKGEAQLTEKLPWNASADLQSARYDFIFANFLKDVPDDLLINLRGNIVARGDKDHINAVANISNAHLYFYGSGFSNSSGITLRLEDKKLSIGSVSMKSETSEIRMAGAVSIGSGYDLLIEGSSSLTPLKALSKNIDILRGDASFVFAITGDWNSPKINGDMDIANGSLGFKNIHYRLSSVSAYLYFDQDRIILDRCSGKLSGGDVTATGTAYLQKFTIKRFVLNSRLRGITASVSKDFIFNFDADLNYRGTLDTQTVLGDIDIKRARYTERIDWKSWLLRTRQRERPKIESSRLDTTNLNVRVSSPNILIANNIAKAALKMDIILKGTIGQPVVLGKVEAKDGIVYFRNNEFKILQTTVDFSNPNRIIPYFTIVAETRVRNYTVRLSLDGTIDQFNVSLSSDPFLAESDIFSLLTVGQIGRNLKGMEGGIGAGEATSFLTGKMQDVLEERLRTITGFDTFQIEPSVYSKSTVDTTTTVSKSSGTLSPRVTATKKIGDNLYVSYSAAVGAGEEQIWRLEYPLGRNVSLVGDRDELGSIGGDIKFHFGFK